MAVELVAVGGSWGGLDALGRLAPLLDPACKLTVVVALHRAPNSPEGAMVSYLQTRCTIPVREADDKDTLEPGHLYVAPADYHLLVEPGRLSLSIDAPVDYSRPSIDVLFQSASDAYGDRLAAVVLSGANQDGCRGVRQVRQRGGRTLAQDPATAVRQDMPVAAIATGAVEFVLPVEQLAEELNRMGRPS